MPNNDQQVEQTTVEQTSLSIKQLTEINGFTYQTVPKPVAQNALEVLQKCLEQLEGDDDADELYVEVDSAYSDLKEFLEDIDLTEKQWQ